MTIENCVRKFAYRTNKNSNGDRSFMRSSNEIQFITKITVNRIYINIYDILYICKDYMLVQQSSVFKKSVLIDRNEWDDDLWDLYKFESKKIIVIDSPSGAGTEKLLGFCDHMDAHVSDNKIHVKPSYTINKKEKYIYCTNCKSTMRIIKTIRLKSDNIVSQHPIVTASCNNVFERWILRDYIKDFVGKFIYRTAPTNPSRSVPDSSFINSNTNYKLHYIFDISHEFIHTISISVVSINGKIYFSRDSISYLNRGKWDDTNWGFAKFPDSSITAMDITKYAGGRCDYIYDKNIGVNVMTFERPDMYISDDDIDKSEYMMSIYNIGKSKDLEILIYDAMELHPDNIKEDING